MIYEVAPGGVVSTFASGLSSPEGMAFNSVGDLFVAEGSLDSIAEITPQGVVSTFASGFTAPINLAFDSTGNLYVSNAGNGTISEITVGGVVSTFASGFANPIVGLAIDSANNVYLSVNTGSTIYKITQADSVTSFATGIKSQSMLFDANGDLLVSDDVSGEIFAITPSGNVNTLVPIATGGPIAFAPEDVPEPATWAWLGGGLSLLLAAWRKFPSSLKLRRTDRGSIPSPRPPESPAR